MTMVPFWPSCVQLQPSVAASSSGALALSEALDIQCAQGTTMSLSPTLFASTLLIQ